MPGHNGCCLWPSGNPVLRAWCLLLPGPTRVLPCPAIWLRCSDFLRRDRGVGFIKQAEECRLDLGRQMHGRGGLQRIVVDPFRQLEVMKPEFGDKVLHNAFLLDRGIHLS